jgi:hypothetical protein
VAPVAITPQISASTIIGAPAPARIPVSRTASAIMPGTSAKSSILAGRPVSRTSLEIVGPSRGHRVPVWKGCGRSLQAPITVVVPSDS